MAIFKQITIVTAALIIGGAAAYFFVPTKMDHHWHELNDKTEEWEGQSYRISSFYEVDGQTATKEAGIWQPDRSAYNVETIVSDDSSFQFTAYFAEKLYVYAGDEWFQSEKNSRFTEEMAPLQQPFDWVRLLLLEADRIDKRTAGSETVYRVFFDEMDRFVFRGDELQKQEKTVLVLKETKGQLRELSFTAVPVRPDTVSILNSYPEKIVYNMTFSETKEPARRPPDEAKKGEPLN